jgi:hypothetical protein
MKRYLCVLFLLLAGCVTVDNRTLFTVGINSFVRPGTEALKTFALFPSQERITADDLQFLEFSAYVERALTSRGFIKASDLSSADLAIFVAYGIGDPKTQTYTYNLPVWGQTGVASSTTIGNVNVYGKTGTYSQTTTNTPQYGIMGYTNHQGSVTTFIRHAFLTAYDLVTFRESKLEKVVWETRMASVGSSGDLRMVFPIMIAASRPYIGVSTGKIMDVSLHEDDVPVLEVKGLPIPEVKTKTKKE